MPNETPCSVTRRVNSTVFGDVEFMSCDGDTYLDARGKDKIRLVDDDATSKSRYIPPAAFFHRIGLNPHLQYRFDSVINYLTRLGAFLDYYDPNRSGDMPSDNFADIKNWCEKAYVNVCETATAQALVGRVFSKGEAKRRADEFARMARVEILPFLFSEDERAAEVLDMTDNDRKDMVFEHYMRAAKVLYEASDSAQRENLEINETMWRNRRAKEIEVKKGITERCSLLQDKMIAIHRLATNTWSLWLTNEESKVSPSEPLDSTRYIATKSFAEGPNFKALKSAVNEFARQWLDFVDRHPQLLRTYYYHVAKGCRWDPLASCWAQYAQLLSRAVLYKPTVIRCKPSGFFDGCPWSGDTFTVEPLMDEPLRGRVQDKLRALEGLRDLGVRAVPPDISPVDHH